MCQCYQTRCIPELSRSSASIKYFNKTSPKLPSQPKPISYDASVDRWNKACANSGGHLTKMTAMLSKNLPTSMIDATEIPYSIGQSEYNKLCSNEAGLAPPAPQHLVHWPNSIRPRKYKAYRKPNDQDGHYVHIWSKPLHSFFFWAEWPASTASYSLDLPRSNDDTKFNFDLYTFKIYQKVNFAPICIS